MLTIRAARREDADAFLSLIDALADYEKLDRPDTEARARLLHDAFERTPPHFTPYLVVEEGTEGTAAHAVGYAITFETYSSFLAKPTLYIEDLFVLPEARGQGAGNALFRFLAAEALRLGCGRMEWVCLDWNELAIGFYEKRGAQHMDDWRYYRLTEEKMREVTGSG
jgi:GNAT superfamily N-acetyltransferase